MDWQIYLAKARNSLRTAQQAYEQGDGDSCVSRAYFAVFHSRDCCLGEIDFRSGKTAGDTIASKPNLIGALSRNGSCLQRFSALPTTISLAADISRTTKINMSVCKRPRNGACAKRSRWCQLLQTYWSYHENPAASDQRCQDP